MSLPVFRAVKRKRYRIPTPIQRKTLPLILAGYDVVAMAWAGSGRENSGVSDSDDRNADGAFLEDWG